MEKPVLYLHVGAPKCGSSSLQAALQHLDKTIPHNVAEAISWHAGAHWANENPSEARPWKDARPWRERDAVLSHESFLNHFERVHPLVCSIFPEHRVRLLVLMRDPDSLARSSLAQLVWTCQHIPSSMQRLRHVRQIGLTAYAREIERRNEKNTAKWVEAAESSVSGDLRDLPSLASEWLGEPVIAALVGRQNTSLSPATVETLLCRLDSFTGTPAEWRAMAREIEGSDQIHRAIA